MSKTQECGNCACNQGRQCSIGPRVQRIATRRCFILRVIESRPFAIACYVAAVVAVVLANLDAFV